MAVKRATSFASCGAQGRNITVLRESNSPLAEFFLDEMLMSKLAYLADIFYHFHLNKLKIHICRGFAQTSLH